MNDWKDFISGEEKKEYYINLKKFLCERYDSGQVYPEQKNIYNAFARTQYKDTKVVILGQDPYHGARQAHGLSFSVADPSGKFPPSLRNIFKELEDDLGVARTNTNLSDWAEQGVLLLNTVLTVEAGQAGSHRGRGWEIFTDTVINRLNDKDEQIIFILWGSEAHGKLSLITNPLHKIVKSVHPSPLSAYRGFFGSRPFSTVNRFLKEDHKSEILW